MARKNKVEVQVLCEACGGEYEVPAAALSASAPLRARGYPAGGRPPAFFAALVDDTVLPTLVRAWHRVSGARRGTLRAPKLLLQSTDRLAELARWADDGGCPTR